MRFSSTQKGVFLDKLRQKYFKINFLILMPCSKFTSIRNLYDHAQFSEHCCTSKLQNHVHALQSSTFFLTCTANCLWKVFPNKVKIFLWCFSNSKMASDELQSVSEKEELLSYLRRLRSDVLTSMQIVRSDLQILYDRLQRVEEGDSQSQTPFLYQRPGQTELKRTSPYLHPPLPPIHGAKRTEQQEEDDAFEHSMAGS